MMGQRNGFSESDLIKINIRYCAKNPTGDRQPFYPDYGYPEYSNFAPYPNYGPHPLQPGPNFGPYPPPPNGNFIAQNGPPPNRPFRPFGSIFG